MGCVGSGTGLSQPPIPDTTHTVFIALLSHPHSHFHAISRLVCGEGKDGFGVSPISMEFVSGVVK